VGNHSFLGECLPAQPGQDEKVFMAIKTHLAFPTLYKVLLSDFLLICFVPPVKKKGNPAGGLPFPVGNET